MDSPAERMPIACVHCAKAKAKCDKKVPCSRCVGKQIVCQSRATRRSSQNTNKRGNLPRTHSERTLHASAFHVSQLGQFAVPLTQGQEMPLMSPMGGISQHSQHSCHSLPDMTHTQQLQMSTTMLGPDSDHQMMRGSYGNTPPDMNFPITPMMTTMPQLDAFIHMNSTQYDPEGDSQFLSMSTHNGLMEFDASNILTDFMSPHSILQDQTDHYFMTPSKGTNQPPNHNSTSLALSETMTHHMGPDLDLNLNNSSPPSMNIGPYRTSTGLSPAASSSASSRLLQEPDAVLASHQAWPFFQCNKVEKYSFFPPKTASIYLEGLAQTLRNQVTWNAWTAHMNEQSLDISTERKIITEPMVGWSREKLLAITQGFLHKALDIHKVSLNAKEEDPASPDSGHETFLMLPPPEVMQYFLRSYVVRYEPYYSSVPGGRLDPNILMHSSNSKAASLLILLMVASGATATATVEARYLASGLTEACRISLFDNIEKDVSQARDVVVLRSALLFTCLAAWSGDKWHMDMAMGQRGMYIAMLNHSGMLDVSNVRINIQKCKLDPFRAWEDWKEHEGRHRLAHSWVIMDQEMSLFSDTTPLLSCVDLHAPMPDSDDLWHAESATEWLSIFENIHGDTYHSAASVREFFTRFVDGDLAGKELSPTQLRLLLHPLQAQVCQLRQFIACLPDGSSSHHKASRAVSKSATKARLEEISALLQQWYVISKQSFSGNRGTCWTTCANLIMYHLISLNAISSFKCIEQFARREVGVGGNAARHALWLQMRCIDQTEETFFHCGQVLRLVRSMPKPVRPPWWAGAIYRVALTAWAASMAAGGGNARFNGVDPDSDLELQFPIDGLTPEHDSISRYVKYQEGMPMLTAPDGRLVPVSVPSNVLGHCIDVLEDDSSMRLTDGIKRKLRVFMENWRES